MYLPLPDLNHKPVRLLFIFCIILFLIFITISINRFHLQLASRDLAIFPSETSEISRYQALNNENPDNPTILASLGLAYLQVIRETGDSRLYADAQAVLDQALALDPQHPSALVGQGQMALSQHRFQDALAWGEQARAVNPFSPEPLAILVDAHVELGRSDEATELLQTMVDLKPGVPAYSRISYLRELHGDIEGAISAMEMAAAMSGPTGPNRMWTEVHLAEIYLNQGQLDEARVRYEAILLTDPDNPHANADLGLILAEQGEHEKALALYHPLVEQYPTAEFLKNLGDIYAIQGKQRLAHKWHEQAREALRADQQAGAVLDDKDHLFLNGSR